MATNSKSKIRGNFDDDFDDFESLKRKYLEQAEELHQEKVKVARLTKQIEDLRNRQSADSSATASTFWDQLMTASGEDVMGKRFAQKCIIDWFENDVSSILVDETKNGNNTAFKRFGIPGDNGDLCCEEIRIGDAVFKNVVIETKFSCIRFIRDAKTKLVRSTQFTWANAKAWPLTVADKHKIFILFGANVLPQSHTLEAIRNEQMHGDFKLPSLLLQRSSTTARTLFENTFAIVVSAKDKRVQYVSGKAPLDNNKERATTEAGVTLTTSKRDDGEWQQNVIELSWPLERQREVIRRVFAQLLQEQQLAATNRSSVEKITTRNKQSTMNNSSTTSSTV